MRTQSEIALSAERVPSPARSCRLRAMNGEVFEKIREAARYVADNARYVRIETERIPDYARPLPIDRIERLGLDPAYHYTGDEASTVAYIVTLDSINFGSGYFPHLRKGPGLSGYMTIASALTERFRADGPIAAERLSSIDDVECARIFGQDLSDPVVAELMGLYARALNDLGAYLIARFDGSFPALIEEAGGSAARLVGILSEQPFFRDVSVYKGREVPFYKRAQILAADLSLAFDRSGAGRFDDIDRLTIFADNLVPHVLRIDGILSYESGLSERIEREELIEAGSEEEVEIRACALHAVELIAAALKDEGIPVSPHRIDLLLWNRGQSPAYKRLPRHRTRTVFY